MANQGLGKMHLDLYTSNSALTHKAKFWCNYVGALKGKFCSEKDENVWNFYYVFVCLSVLSECVLPIFWKLVGLFQFKYAYKSFLKVKVVTISKQ